MLGGLRTVRPASSAAAFLKISARLSHQNGEQGLNLNPPRSVESCGRRPSTLVWLARQKELQISQFYPPATGSCWRAASSPPDGGGIIIQRRTSWGRHAEVQLKHQRFLPRASIAARNAIPSRGKRALPTSIKRTNKELQSTVQVRLTVRKIQDMALAKRLSPC